MDPNENLKEQLELASEIVNSDLYETGSKAERLAELALALDEWLSRGGTPPDRWVRGRPRTHVLKATVDVPPGHASEFRNVRVFALVNEEKGLMVYAMTGLVDINMREECRQMMTEQMHAEGVWFEDEIGTDKDLSHRLPKEEPAGASATCPSCHTLGRKRCPLHGKARPN